MNVLAASEGNAIFVIVALIVAAIGQWNEARKKKQAEEEQSNTPPMHPPARPNNTAESEQERLRRFLENLGVPAPAQQKPARVQPAPRSATVPAQVVKRATQQPRPPKQKKPRVAEPLPLESRDPGRLEEPASAIEQVAKQYEGMAKGVEVPQPDPSPAPAAAALTLDRPQNTLNVALRAMLKSPQNLRAALLAREILGPPKSLAE